jgi:hypothetical protein
MEELQIWHGWERGISKFCFERCLIGHEQNQNQNQNQQQHELSVFTESDEADMALMHMWESRCESLETELQIITKAKDLMSKELKDVRSGRRGEEDRTWKLLDDISELQAQIVMEKDTNNQLHERMRWTEEELYLMRERERKVLTMKGRNGSRQMSYIQKKKMDSEVLV